jgi:hypothetical protein
MNKAKLLAALIKAYRSAYVIAAQVMGGGGVGSPKKAIMEAIMNLGGKRSAANAMMSQVSKDPDALMKMIKGLSQGMTK